jgi:hypothetical protein
MFAVEDPIVWKETVIMIMRTPFSPIQEGLLTKPNVSCLLHKNKHFICRSVSLEVLCEINNIIFIDTVS